MIYKFPLIYFCRLTVVSMKALSSPLYLWCGVAPSVNHNGCDVAAVMLPRAELLLLAGLDSFNLRSELTIKINWNRESHYYFIDGFDILNCT